VSSDTGIDHPLFADYVKREGVISFPRYVSQESSLRPTVAFAVGMEVVEICEKIGGLSGELGP
jgi:hypothetical protein